MKKLTTILASISLCILISAPAFAERASHVNSIGMEFVPIPAGKFIMGDNNGRFAERPGHEVAISKPFYLGKYEVTQAQWTAVMGNNPSKIQGPDYPVEQVGWDDAQAFIAKLNRMEGVNRYRLPTEAEWEYAARAGSVTQWCFGDDPAQLPLYAWFDKNSQDTSHPVGQKEPNGWGLHDMHGNVWEWTADYWDSGFYSKAPAIDPTGPASGSKRVKRGGSWLWSAEYTRSAYRVGDPVDTRISRLGFRLVLEMQEEQ